MVLQVEDNGSRSEWPEGQIEDRAMTSTRTRKQVSTPPPVEEATPDQITETEGVRFDASLVSTPEAFVAETEALGERAKELERAQEHDKRLVRFTQCTNVYLAMTAGFVGAKAPHSQWASKQDYARALGCSPGGLVGMERMGALIMRGGLTVEHDAWGVLSSKAGTGEVKRMVEGVETPDPDAIAKVLGQNYDAYGRRKSGGTGQPDDGSGTGDETGDESTDESGDSGAMKRWGKALDGAREVIAQHASGKAPLTAAELRTVQAGLTSLLTEVTEALKPKDGTIVPDETAQAS